MGFREVAIVDDVYAIVAEAPLKVDERGYPYLRQDPVRIRLVRPPSDVVVVGFLFSHNPIKWESPPAVGPIIGPVRIEADGPCLVEVSSRSGRQRFEMTADAVDVAHQ